MFNELQNLRNNIVLYEKQLRQLNKKNSQTQHTISKSQNQNQIHNQIHNQNQIHHQNHNSNENQNKTMSQSFIESARNLKKSKINDDNCNNSMNHYLGNKGLNKFIAPNTGESKNSYSQFGTDRNNETMYNLKSVLSKIDSKISSQQQQSKSIFEYNNYGNLEQDVGGINKRDFKY